MFTAANMLCVMQFGNYLAGPGFPSGHNISNYTFFDFTDLPGYADLRPVLGTCFHTKNSEALSSMETLVDVCALAQGTCCFNFAQNEVAQVGYCVVHTIVYSLSSCTVSTVQMRAASRRSYASPYLLVMLINKLVW